MHTRDVHSITKHRIEVNVITRRYSHVISAHRLFPVFQAKCLADLRIAEGRLCCFGGGGVTSQSQLSCFKGHEPQIHHFKLLCCTQNVFCAQF
jgi:hypothetical protein